MQPRILALLVPWLAAPHGTPVHAQEWPQLPLPAQVRPFEVGGPLTHNGVPMRLQGFVASIPPAALVELFRRRLGEPLVESRLGDRRILGRAQGGFYVTVQIEPAAQGSRGVLATSHLQAAKDSGDSDPDARAWASRLPAGSRLLSHMVSRDGARLSTHIVFVNGHGDALNAHGLSLLLADGGLSLEHDVPAGSGRALFFRGAGKEAIATLHRGAQAQTSVVLNLVTRIEGAR